jgi:hypothetical protein
MVNPEPTVIIVLSMVLLSVDWLDEDGGGGSNNDELTRTLGFIKILIPPKSIMTKTIKVIVILFILITYKICYCYVTYHMKQIR